MLTPLERIQKEIKDAFDDQDYDGWKKNSQRYLDYLKGNYFDRASQGKRYTVNSVFNFVNLIVPNLFFQEPAVRVKAKRKFIKKKTSRGDLLYPSWKVAQVFEHIINKTLPDIRFGDEVRKCVQDVLFYGFAVMKCGYGADTESTPDNTSREASSETPRVREGEIFCMRVSPLDFVFDPMATSMEDARFVVHRLVKPLKEIQENDLYENTSKIPKEIPEDYKKKRRNAEKK